MNDKVWAVLCDCKFKSYILTYLVEKYQKWDRNINIFLAITSSASIGAWAVWKELPFLWGGIIALSQVLNVVKPYLPYYKLVKELNVKSIRMETLNIDIESLWYKIENKKINEDDTAEKYFEIKKQLAEILNFNDDSIFAVSSKMMAKANERMRIFLKTNYEIEITIPKK
jgi:hypothetical protein